MNARSVGAQLVLGIPVVVRWLALIVLPFLLLRISPPFIVFVVAVPVLAVVIELAGNSLLLAVLHRQRRPTAPAIEKILAALARETDDRIPEIVHLGVGWPAMCEVRLRLLSATALVISDQAARHLLKMSLARRFERAADSFAGRVAGVDAVIEALNATSSGDTPEMLSAFSTHDTVAVRRQALDGSA